MTISGSVGLMAYKKTPEHQAKITAALRGRQLSSETVAKRSATWKAKGVNRKHGHGSAKDGRTPTYFSWMNMIQRCTNPKAPGYPYYGGHGIAVCKRWREFAAFLADMGERPEGTTLDRIDGGKDYEPGNCRWATKDVQMSNRARSSYYDRPSRVPDCHPDRPHKARGKCASCYLKWRTSHA